MTAAVAAALAAWCAVLPPSSRRCRAVFASARPARRADPALVSMALGLLAAVILLGWVPGVIVGLAVAPLLHRAVTRLESAASRRRRARIASQLPGALDLMVAALSVGRAPGTAFALAAEATPDPLGAELDAVAKRLAVAADPMTVWTAVAADPALAAVARAFRRAEQSGMPVAHVVSGVADELRREARARRRDDSRKVAVRTAAPLGACFLPAFFLVGIVPMIIGTFRTFTW